MKNSIIFLTFLSVFYSTKLQGQLPSEFPKDLLNKIYCGNVDRAYFIYLGEVQNNLWTSFDYKVFISEDDGIYVEYNPKQKYGEDNMGKTDMIKRLPLWTMEPYVQTDKYGDLTGGKKNTYNYKVYPNTKKDHHIISVSLTVYEDGFVFLNGNIAKGYWELSIKINVPGHKDATIIIDSKDECGKLKSKFELQKEEQERISFENRKRDAEKAITNKIIENIKNDKLEEALKEFPSLSFPDEFPSEYSKLLKEKQDANNLKKIQEYLSNKLPDEAAKIYNSLNKKNPDLKSDIQNALNQKYQNDTASLNTRILEQLIELNKDKLAALTAGKNTLVVSQDGKTSILGNQSLSLNQPQRNVSEIKEIEGFNLIRLPSKAVLNVELKKTPGVNKNILVSTNKMVRQKRNGTLYQVNTLNIGIYDKEVPVTFSSDVPKGSYWITQDAITHVYINGSEIIQKETKDKIEEGKLSKRVPKQIWRSFSVICWASIAAFSTTLN
jgi:hypothetical protein